ncbi:lysophospholipid acyltransferase family protein [Planctomicrobium sp. SH664]|uniref:lysophospholipid acyltransferase family protein n=1 Tax=Planctomicrobium sp. SH664 TaxID=3448125 RepID=UPI003F5B5CA1
MKIRNRTLIRLLARCLASINRWLFWSCKVHIVEEAPQISPYAPTAERYVYCVWHDGILGALFSGKVHGMAALTSRHADGDYVAVVMQAIGIRPVRGSHNHGGATAIKQMLEGAANVNITITPDGPRGPRRKLKPGIVFLASHSGRKIVPVAISAVKAWRPRGKWTDLLVPLPGTTVYSVGGEPMLIPPGLSRDQLGPYCEELQRRMDELQLRADAMAGSVVPSSAASEVKVSKAA